MTKTKSTAIEPKDYSIDELQIVLNALNLCTDKSKVENTKNILTGIQLNRQISRVFKTYNEDKTELFKTLGLEKKTKIVGENQFEFYSFEDRSEADQIKIKAAIKDINEQRFRINGFNTFTVEEFLLYTESLKAYPQEQANLFEYLVRENELNIE